MPDRLEQTMVSDASERESVVHKNSKMNENIICGNDFFSCVCKVY